MKEKIKFTVLGVLIGLLTSGTVAFAEKPIKILLDEKPIDGAEAIIYNDRTYVPVRVIADAFGFETFWDEENWQVKIKRNKKLGGKPTDLKGENDMIKTNDKTTEVVNLQPQENIKNANKIVINGYDFEIVKLDGGSGWSLIRNDKIYMSLGAIKEKGYEVVWDLKNKNGTINSVVIQPNDTFTEDSTSFYYQGGVYVLNEILPKN